MKLSGLTVFITGASRGIGKAIAIKVAKDGANVVVVSKTSKPHAKLPGTIYTTLQEVEAAGGKGLACAVDVRNEDQIAAAIEQAVNKFGGIDILINNASAINRSGMDISMKTYDLLNNVITRGTFLVTKLCLPYLKKSKHAHILNITPPLDMDPYWMSIHLPYTVAKYGVSMGVIGLQEQLWNFGIAINGLWPLKGINTPALHHTIGKERATNLARTTEIMADAAYAILTQEPKPTGNLFTDEDALKTVGITNFDHYANNPKYKDDLYPIIYGNASLVRDYKSKLNSKL